MLRTSTSLRWVWLAIGAVASCGTDRGNGPASTAIYVPEGLTALEPHAFFDHPWPSDLRRDEQGNVRFAGWPNPAGRPLVAEFVRVTEGLLGGFSPSAAIYFRFSGPLDRRSLPEDPRASIDRSSAIQLLDVDPSSPERGMRRPVLVHFHESSRDAEASYWPPNTLALMPALGQPLRPKTRYAAFVTKRARAAGGGAVIPAPDLEEALGERSGTERTRASRELFAVALPELRAAGIDPRDVAHMTVFTTDDPTEETFRIADHVKSAVAAPTARGWTLTEAGDVVDVYEGTFGPIANYQAGAPPYAKPTDGGAFVFENGTPKVQSTFDARFALSVPSGSACPPPGGGYPIVLYAHGTGGDYRSFLDDGTARALGERCLAVMGVDQIFHGTRPGAPSANDPQREQTIQLLFFNFDNPTAARTSNRQSAIDVVQQARLFTESHVTVPSSVAKTQLEIAFDGTRVLFFGHSQGGLNGPLFLAADGAPRGGVLSGAGSVLAVALLEKTKPVDIPAIVSLLLGVPPDSRDELNLFHPAMTLAQSIVDVTDPIHYASFITRTPRPGFAPKSIFQLEGIAPDGSGDTYAPPRGIEALGVAIGLPRLSPGVFPVREAAWAGLGDLSVPNEGVSGNLGGGLASGAFAQFAPQRGRDGHFVVFDVASARSQSSKFLRALADDPKGRVLPP